jgi:hypothetical protein
MQELTLTRTKTTVTLTDGQVSWTLDRANALRLAAQLVDQAGKLEDDKPKQPHIYPQTIPTGKVVAP